MIPLNNNLSILADIRNQKPRTYEEIRAEITDEDFFRYHYLPFVLMEVYYDYVDTMLGQAAYLRIEPLKKICRMIKGLREEFFYFKRVNLDWHNQNKYTDDMEYFVEESTKEFGAEITLIKCKINDTRTALNSDWKLFIATVYICLIFFDVLKKYCRIADEKIEKHWNRTNLHSILPDDVAKTYPLIKECLGDCDVLSKEDMNSSSERLMNIIQSVTFEGNLKD